MLTVKLKNSKIEVEVGLVKVVTHSLQTLWAEDLSGMLIAYDLVMRCKNPAYQMFSDHEERLKDLFLLRVDGLLNPTIQAIVLASFEGEDLEMELVSPI